MQRLPPHIKHFSRILRSEMTDAEAHLWRQLRGCQLHGFKFRRQHPVGRFILDFACIEAKLAVEIDGGQHQELQHEDRQRSLTLETQGWRILRFWNNEVLQNIEGVVVAIEGVLVPPP